MPACNGHQGRHQRLDRVITDVHVSWREAALLRGFLEGRRELLGPLQEHGLGGYMMATTIRDGILIGCRRSIDRGDDVRSVPTALRKLGRLTPELTPDCLETVLDALNRPEASWDDYHAALAALQAEDWETRGDDLHDRHADTWRTLTRRLAHASRRPAPAEIDEQLAADAGRALRDVQEAASLAHGAITNIGLAELDIDIPEARGIAKMLRMFSWPSFVEQLHDHEQRTRRYLSIEEAAESATVTYSWPDNAGHPY